MRLCAVAGVSTKSFYQRKKGPTRKELSGQEITSIIRSLQETYGNSLDYRKMKHRLNDDYGMKLGDKKVLRLMEDAKVLSAVRRKHFSEEYYLLRRELRIMPSRPDAKALLRTGAKDKIRMR